MANKSRNICSDENCPNHGRYCRRHPEGEVKQPRKIKKESKKRAEVKKKEYLPQVMEWIRTGEPCRVKSPVCTGKAQGGHHLKGREGDNYTDFRYIIPCCNPCNGWLEENDLWARANGFKLSKHADFKRSA